MDQQLQNSVRHEDFLRNALVKLKQRIFSFTQNTKIDPNNLFTALHNALDDVGVIVHEKIAFIDQQKKDWQDLAVDLVDEELEKLGTRMEGLFHSPLAAGAKKLALADLQINLGHLNQHTIDLSAETNLDQLFFLEKLHQALSNIEDVAIIMLRVDVDEKTEKKRSWLTLQEISDKMIAKGLLDKNWDKPSPSKKK